jgi:repressor LexA
MAKPLTAKQAAFVAYWHDFAASHGYPPTVRELCAHFGYRSTNAAHEKIQEVEAKGIVLARRKKAVTS